MRLWHSKLLPLLDGKRLCDVHMSCCNLRGKGWGKRNAAVGYLYEDPLGEDALYEYHLKVLNEMEWRGYEPNENWFDPHYCGKKRAGRPIDYERLEAAARRNIPLKGHTLEIFRNDVRALRERGVDIKVEYSQDTDELGEYIILKASHNNKEITYGLRLHGGKLNEQND